MKNLILRLIALAVLACCILSFASCGGSVKPELNMKDAEDALEDEGYTVETGDGDDYIENNSYSPYYGYALDEYLEAHDDDYNYLYIYVFESASMAKLYYKGIAESQEMYIANIQTELDYYNKLLKKYEDDMDRDHIKELEDEIESLEEDLEERVDEYVFGIKGKTVWYGTLDAVEDSRG